MIEHALIIARRRLRPARVVGHLLYCSGDPGHTETKPVTAGSEAGSGRRPLVQYIASHALGLIAEWGALIGLLVYTFDHSGPRAVGIASFASLVPYVLLAATTARLAQRHPAAMVRTIGMVGQGIGFAVTGAVGVADGPLWLVVAAAGVGFTAATAMRPSGAVLLPALVRTSRELTTANVWVGYADSSALMLGPLSATVLLGLHGPGAALLRLARCCRGAAPPSRRVRSGTARPPLPTATQRERPLPARGRSGWSRARSPTSSGSPVAPVPRGAQHRPRRVHARGRERRHLGRRRRRAHRPRRRRRRCARRAVRSRVVPELARLWRAARRPRLAPLMLTALAVDRVLCCIALGSTITLVAALVLIPVLGLSRALLDLLARMLLQRSAPPSELASVFGAMETTAGLGLLSGSLLAQVLIAWSGAAAALVGVGVMFAGILALGADRCVPPTTRPTSPWSR